MREKIGGALAQGSPAPLAARRDDFVKAVDGVGGDGLGRAADGGRRRRVERPPRDAHDRAPPREIDDLARIIGRVDDAGGGGREAGEIGGRRRPFGLVEIAQKRPQRDTRRERALGQPLPHRGEYAAMQLLREMRGFQKAGDRRQRLAAQEAGAEHGLLGLYVGGTRSHWNPLHSREKSGRSDVDRPQSPRGGRRGGQSPARGREKSGATG